MIARRVACLLPAATEIVAAIGAADRIVGISHECDFPESVLDRPRLTRTPVDGTATGAAIDAQVRELMAAGSPVIAVDGDLLERAAPDLIIAQDLCDVCAVTDGALRRLSGTGAIPILPLRGRTVAGIREDIRRVGRMLGAEAGAAAVEAGMTAALAGLPTRPLRPRVVVVEWLEPVYLAGHWVPELVAAAGGTDVGAMAGAHSAVVPFTRVVELRPDLVVVALCGMGIERARAEWRRFLAGDGDDAAAARTLAAPVHFLDGHQYTSRPGPRIVEAARQLAALLTGLRPVPDGSTATGR